MTARGTVYELPELLRWRIRLTGGVPCDSFEAACLYGAEMAEVLESACRFEAVEDGAVVFRGVIDEWSAEMDDSGAVLTLTGRGMAALLLDNETEAASYQWAGVREIVRRYVVPCGIECVLPERECGVGAFTVTAGASRWKAVERFASRCGLTAYVTAQGVLHFCAADAAERRALGTPEGVIAARWCDKRYGVLSAVTLVHRTSGERATVRNEAFEALGGRCEWVLYGTQELRATAEERLRESAEGSRVLVLTMAGGAAFTPFERVSLRLTRLGIAGDFRVKEVVRALDARGETTEVTLWKE